MLSEPTLLAQLIQSYARTSKLHKAKQLHARLILSGSGADTSSTFISNHLLNMYAKCGDLHHALSLFDVMPQRNLVTWTAMISGFSQNRHFHCALQTFTSMCSSGLKPTQFAFSSAIQASVSFGSLVIGKQLHSLSFKSGYSLELFVGSNLADMYSKLGSLADACKVFDEMPLKDEVSWNAMIDGYAKNGDFEQALAAFRSMFRENIVIDQHVLCSALSASGGLKSSEFGRSLQSVVVKFGFQKEIFIWRHTSDGLRCLVKVASVAHALVVTSVSISDVIPRLAVERGSGPGYCPTVERCSGPGHSSAVEHSSGPGYSSAVQRSSSRSGTGYFSTVACSSGPGHSSAVEHSSGPGHSSAVKHSFGSGRSSAAERSSRPGRSLAGFIVATNFSRLATIPSTLTVLSPCSGDRQRKVNPKTGASSKEEVATGHNSTNVNSSRTTTADRSRDQISRDRPGSMARVSSDESRDILFPFILFSIVENSRDLVTCDVFRPTFKSVPLSRDKNSFEEFPSNSSWDLVSSDERIQNSSQTTVLPRDMVNSINEIAPIILSSIVEQSWDLATRDVSRPIIKSVPLSRDMASFEEFSRNSSRDLVSSDEKIQNSSQTILPWVKEKVLEDSSDARDPSLLLPDVSFWKLKPCFVSTRSFMSTRSFDLLCASQSIVFVSTRSFDLLCARDPHLPLGSRLFEHIIPWDPPARE